MKNFGRLLKTLRINAKYTQKEFAEKLNTSSSTISKWENSLSYPDIQSLREIAHILNITYEELLNPTDTLMKMENQTFIALEQETYTNSSDKHIGLSIFIMLCITFLINIIIKIKKCLRHFNSPAPQSLRG